MSESKLPDIRRLEKQASVLAFLIVAITRSLHYITSFILLFLLAPEDFGLIAVGMAFIAIMNALTNFGVDAALISYQDDESSLLNDAWTFELIKGVLLSSLMFLTAPLVAIWLEQPSLSDLLKFLSLAFILQSGKNVSLISERKRFKFVNLFKCELIMAMCNSFVTIYIAISYLSPWAIAVGYVAGWAVYTLLSFLICDFRPRLSVNLTNFWFLFNYSRWVLISSQINTTIENGVNIFVGSYFGMSVLGQFERADMFTRKTVLQVGEVVWKIGLPSLATRASDLTRLRTYYLGLFRLICFLVFPILSVLILYLATLVGVNDNDDWARFNGFIQILGLVALLTMLTIPASVLFQALRVPEIGVIVSVVRLTITIGVMLPFITFFEEKGVAYTLLVSIFTVVPISLWHVRRLTGVSVSQHLLIASEYMLPSTLYFLWDMTCFSGTNTPVEVLGLSVLYVVAVLIISPHARELSRALSNKIF